jgi:hypothetical protein
MRHRLAGRADMPVWIVGDSALAGALRCIGLLYLTLVFLRRDSLKTAAAWGGSRLVGLSRAVAAAIAWLFDKVIPVDSRNALSRINFAVWILLNLAVVVGWTEVGWFVGPRSLFDLAAAVAGVFAILNLTLLGGAYWALREGIEIMNGDVKPEHQKFADISTSRSVIFFFGTAIALIAQIAVVLEWIQEARAVPLVVDGGAIATSYLNFLVAVVDALPLVSFYVASLSSHTSFAAGFWGQAVERGLNDLGSILIVSTGLSFIQQHMAFRRMIDRLVEDPSPVLLARFKHAPSAIKSYVLGAFLHERDDRKRIRLAELAVDRRSFRFPRLFAINYAGLSDTLRENGATIVARFLDAEDAKFNAETLLAILDACERHIAGRKMIDKRRLARFVVPCLERLANADPGVADQRIGHVVVQKILRSALNHRVADDLRRRAAVLLIRVPSYEAIPHLVRAAPMMGNPTSVSVLDWAAKTLAKKSLILPPAKTLHLLKRMEAAVREVERRSAALSPAAIACLAKVKSQV